MKKDSACLCKENIEKLLENVRVENQALCESLYDRCYLTDYVPCGNIWTSALQNALNEHEEVIIPFKETPYVIDNSIIVPSNRHIIASEGATIQLASNVRVLMVRNSNTEDGTHYPITKPRNQNITIEGGIWQEWCQHRMGYGSSGMYDENRSFFGVSTCMLLENVDNLTLKNMTFKNCGGFAVQLGEAKNVVIENITFEKCFADGIHVNGNVENLYISNVKGQVGDDLVALNMFDWQNSSVNFGPCKNIICQDLELSLDSHYKALRIEPGLYTFKNGTVVDCSLTNAIFRRIKNIKTFKLYCQTPVYAPTEAPEPTDVGSGDNIFFEDIKIDLDGPIDKFEEYLNGDKNVGTFAGFELGLNVGSIYFKNIDITLHRDIFPQSYLMCIGPKSIRLEDGREVFDPYLSSVAENVYFENITVNEKKPDDISPFVKEIVFDRLYLDISSSGSGKIKNIIYR